MGRGIFGSSVKLVPITLLKIHETIYPPRVVEIKKNILKIKYVCKPIIADNKTLVVLDGHHRLQALKRIGCALAPVYLVDYFGKDVRIYLRKKSLLMPLLKKAVIFAALSEAPFSYKTTRHYILNRPFRPISLNLLQQDKKKGGEKYEKNKNTT